MTTREKNQLRNLTYLPLAAAIFAGAVYTGTAVSSAAADPGVEPSATGQYSWMVMNYTGQTLTTGEFHKQRGENSSSVVFGGAASQPELTPGTYAYAWQQRKPFDLAPKYTWGGCASTISGGTCAGTTPDLNGITYTSTRSTTDMAGRS
ncbi:hypothetical protein R3Q06_35040 [Rhodococcus erythropolis]|uniref:hypothetical protein n=1 Tax=Rhodococcus erythropolis TaxID=1833 RepID=UPI002948F530|nr:hypothetical protein [Rhodococcus erythropolis]MDV6278607.1 hypothetical protein [Rhodococcus erythropolis]